MKHTPKDKLSEEYVLIRAAIKEGKNIHELVNMMSRQHFYNHIYKNGLCECGLTTTIEK